MFSHWSVEWIQGKNERPRTPISQPEGEKGPNYGIPLVACLVPKE